MMLLAEFQQGIAVLGKGGWRAAQLRDHTRVVKNRVPDQIGKKHLEQGGNLPNRSQASGQAVDQRGDGALQSRHEDWLSLLLNGSQVIGQFAEGLRSGACRQMVD